MIHRLSIDNIQVLDKGFVEIIDYLGSDLTVVNSARVSFGKRKTKYEDEDSKLVRFLAKNKHYSTFRHIVVQFHVKAPEFVMRQWYKHVVGIETSNSSMTKDHAWNEISGRYVPIKDFYTPEKWRQQSVSNKQGSADNLPPELNFECASIFDDFMDEVKEVYEKLLKKGVAKEQARIILPLNQYTEVIWTCSAQALLNFIELRDEPTAQVEIREYAIKMRELIKDRFPVLYNIWFDIE